MKLNKTSIFWSIPAITVYFYSANILAQYGYISYFGISTSFLESSLKDNIIYFFQLFKVIFSLFGLINAWYLLIIVPVILMISIFYNPYSWRKVAYFVSPILLLLFLWFSYDFAYKLASYTESYYVIAPECINSDKEAIYIIPDIYDSKLILVPVDKATNRMKGGFFVKNSSDINCIISYQKTGKIIK